MEEEELLNMRLSDIKSPVSAPSIRHTKIIRQTENLQLDVDHYWEVCGLCGCTVNVCSSIEQAKMDAAHRYYWEIWLVTLGKRALISSINSKDEEVDNEQQ